MATFGATTEPHDLTQSDDVVDGRKVVAIRVGEHPEDKFDRVTFELTGLSAPGFWVGYTETASRDGSGEEVEVPGSEVLSVIIRGVDWANEAVSEYDGHPLDSSGSAVVGVRWDGSFEGTTQAFIGTTGRLPFRVGRLENPARLYVDVVHP